MNSIKKKHLVCDLNELTASISLGIEINFNGSTVKCCLIYHKNEIFSYINSCPHTGVNLDWVPNQFLDRENTLIQCSTHGALFNIHDGLCVRGPCFGKKLRLVENELLDGKIYLVL